MAVVMVDMIVKRIIFLLLLTSCSGVKVYNENERRTDLYRNRFLVKIRIVQESYRQGQFDSALQTLKSMNRASLWPMEKAVHRNLTGMVLFSQRQYKGAVVHFNGALARSEEGGDDEGLTAQITLNLASGYFKMGLKEKAVSTLEQLEVEYLSGEDATKYHKLMYKLSVELADENRAVLSLIYYLGPKTKISELENDLYFKYLLSYFLKLSRSEKWTFLEEFEDENFLCIAYLAYLELEELYYKGSKDDAKDLLEWLGEKFETHAEISILIKNFAYRVEDYEQINSRAIGVVLPLSGRNQRFGQRALLGVDSAFRQILEQKQEQERGDPYRLYVEDSEGSGGVGAFRVQELIEKHHVSAIIGGLFSTEALKEYLEARRRGVLFISLSPIYLPKKEKNHLLLEVPGSVESQLHKLFSEKMLNRFGRRVAIVYPKGPRGEAYVNEFWRLSQRKGKEVEVNGVHLYKKGQTDYRDPVRKLLGLKFIRNRQEELELLQDVYALEGKQSIRRIQTLRPSIDFDWVFLPAIPKEAIQIIPAFGYFDAFGLRLFGGPSWRSRSLSRESENGQWGPLYFVGDDIHPQKTAFAKSFISRYTRRPKLIEMRAYDSFRLVDSLLKGGRFSSRDEFDLFIQKKATLQGMTGQWKLIDGVWIKEMIPLTLAKGKVHPLEKKDEAL